MRQDGRIPLLTGAHLSKWRIRNRFKPKMGVVSVKSTHLRYRFSGEQKFPSCIAQEGKDAWREISRSIRSRIRGGVRLCLSCRKPPHLAFEAIAAFSRSLGKLKPTRR